jgi:tetratricopeptide (TPR) repeat protein
LDGLPLALELAGAQVKFLSVQELAAGLVGRTRLPMRQRARDLPRRHHTLRDAIDWSYRLLTPSEQRFFAQLSVFRGGFDLDAALAICLTDDQGRTTNDERSLISNLQSLTPTSSSNDDAPSDPSLVLQSLIDKSLVQMVLTASPARFMLLETLREYAQECLASEAGRPASETEATQRHALYYLALAESVTQPAIDGGGQVVLERLARDYDNLRAAAHWLLDHDVTGAMRLCVALTSFWHRYGYYAEGRSLLQQALDRAGDVPTTLRARGYLEMGAIAQHQEDASETLRSTEISLSLYRSLGDTRGMAQSLRQLGWAAFLAHDRPAAEKHFRDSLALYREQSDMPNIAEALTSLAHVVHRPGVNDAQVNELLQDSLDILRELGLTLAQAHTLEEQGYLEADMGHSQVAESRYMEALAIFQKAGHRHDVAWTLCALGEVAWHQGQLDKAERYFQECQHTFLELGARAGIAIALHHTAQVQRKRGLLDEAERLYGQSLSLSTEQANERMRARCLAGLGGVALARGQAERAAELLSQARALFARLPPFLAPADRAEYESFANTAGVPPFTPSTSW